MSGLVSIIIATYNAEATLDRCLKSVMSQSYEPKQIVVMDGMSTDGTLEILRQYPCPPLQWKSEKDSGIYNAWNKALDPATGEWVCFLGADDYWSDVDSLRRMVELGEKTNADLVSTRGLRIDAQGKSKGMVGEGWDWSRMKKWQCVLHAGLLQRKSLFNKFGKFNDGYRIAGDYDFLMRLGPAIRTAHLPEGGICIGDGGVSRTNVAKALQETRRIQSAHKEIGPVRARYNYTVAQTKALIRSLLCR
jgi:glycosyltransferase involved in cell wall biosynthesis